MSNKEQNKPFTSQPATSQDTEKELKSLQQEHVNASTHNELFQYLKQQAETTPNLKCPKCPSQSVAGEIERYFLSSEFRRTYTKQGDRTIIRRKGPKP